MENGIKVFEQAGFGSIRVVMQSSEPWFVASDVAKALGYEKACFEKHTFNLAAEFKDTLGLDLFRYDPSDLNAFLVQDSTLLISDFGLGLLFEYLCDHDSKHIKSIVDRIDIGYVYVIDDINNNKRKIGKTKHPHTRILSVCSSSGVKNKKVFLSGRLTNCSVLEKFLKVKFVDENIHGEWFKSPFEEIVEALKQKEVRISPILEKLKTVAMENSSHALFEHIQRFTGWTK